MKVKFLLTPSAKIQGLPSPIPKEGETASLNNKLAEQMIARGWAVPAGGQPKQVKAVPPKPAVSETKSAKIANPKEKEDS